MLDALKNMDNTLSFCLCSYAGRVWKRRIYLSLNQANTCFYIPALMPKERLKISFAGKELLTNLLMR